MLTPIAGFGEAWTSVGLLRTRARGSSARCRERDRRDRQRHRRRPARGARTRRRACAGRSAVEGGRARHRRNRARAHDAGHLHGRGAEAARRAGAPDCHCHREIPPPVRADGAGGGGARAADGPPQGGGARARQAGRRAEARRASRRTCSRPSCPGSTVTRRRPAPRAQLRRRLLEALPLPRSRWRGAGPLRRRRVRQGAAGRARDEQHAGDAACPAWANRVDVGTGRGGERTAVRHYVAGEVRDGGAFVDLHPSTGASPSSARDTSTTSSCARVAMPSCRSSRPARPSACCRHAPYDALDRLAPGDILVLSRTASPTHRTRPTRSSAKPGWSGPALVVGDARPSLIDHACRHRRFAGRAPQFDDITMLVVRRLKG